VIVYALQCSEGHGFEAWFPNSDAFELQGAEGKLICPMCETRSVTKAPMAPALAGRGSPVSAPRAGSVSEVHTAPDEMRRMRQFMTGLRKYVEQHADYVGPAFPEEARKIHYGEAEERQIYGEASLRDVKELIEEGVDIAPLPPDPNEAN